MAERELAGAIVQAIRAAIIRIGLQAEANGGPSSFTAGDIARDIQKSNSDLIHRICRELALSPEEAFAWLKVRIEGILIRVSQADNN
jgi:hypothetical protein